MQDPKPNCIIYSGYIVIWIVLYTKYPSPTLPDVSPGMSFTPMSLSIPFKPSPPPLPLLYPYLQNTLLPNLTQQVSMVPDTDTRERHPRRTLKYPTIPGAHRALGLPSGIWQHSLRSCQYLILARNPLKESGERGRRCMFSYPRRAPGVGGVVGWSGAWGEGGTLTRGGFEKRLLFVPPLCLGCFTHKFNGTACTCLVIHSSSHIMADVFHLPAPTSFLF